MIESFFWRRFLVRVGVAQFLPGVRRTLLGGERHLHRFSDRLLAAPLNDLLDPNLMPEITTPESIDFALGVPRVDLPLSTRGASTSGPLPAWGRLDLRTELAERFQLDHGPEHDPATEALITHGATGAVSAVLDAFVNPGDRVVLFDPTSPIFRIGLKHRRANVTWVPTTSDNGHLRFDLAHFTRAMRGAKLLILAEPGNPTGCTFAPEELEQIAFWANKFDALILQDASFDRWRDGPAKARLASLPHTANRLLTCGSYSKSHGLSAARVGWLIGDRHLVRPTAIANLLASPFVPAVAQHLAIQAEQTGEKALAALREVMSERRAYVRERLEAMGLKPCSASAGFFHWVPVPGTESARDFAQRLLRDTGLLVGPGEPFGPSGAKFVRLSFAIDEGRLREGLSWLGEWMAKNSVERVNEDQATSSVAAY